MNARDVFKRYRAERRGQRYGGFDLELTPHFSRYVATFEKGESMVAFAEFDAAELDDAITEQIEYFKSRHQNFEWKVYDFDSPRDLRDRLEQRGFRAGDKEAFLIMEISRWSPPLRPLGSVRIEKISSRSQLIDFVAAEQAIWSEDFAWHVEKYARDLATDPNAMSIYCAYEGNAPIGTGRVSFPIESSFAELNGGGVLPALRGKGIFSALLSRRIEEARARGYRWIAVDAAPMSRPILLRKGFQNVCWTYPMRYRF